MVVWMTERPVVLKVDANQPIDQGIGGKSYEYRSVAPVDGADGGKPGSNIRLGILTIQNEAATSGSAWDTCNPARIGL